MKLIKNISRVFTRFKERTNSRLRKIMIPFGKGVTLYKFVVLFMKGVSAGYITTRAASISFKLFMALFPGIIFIFTIIPYIPIGGFYSNLMLMIGDVVPETLFPLVEQTIEDIAIRKRSGLLSFGFLMAFYFSSSSFMSIISSFNQSINVTDMRKGWQQRLVSVALVIISTLMVIIAIALIAFSQDRISWLVEQGWMDTEQNLKIFFAGRWIILTTILYITISLIYFLAPAKRDGYSFFSIGSLIATLFFILIGWGFGYFVTYFSAHNILYGSIGTLLLLLLYIYYNAIVLLIGFELNAGIAAAQKSSRG